MLAPRAAAGNLWPKGHGPWPSCFIAAGTKNGFVLSNWPIDEIRDAAGCSPRLPGWRAWPPGAHQLGGPGGLGHRRSSSQGVLAEKCRPPPRRADLPRRRPPGTRTRGWPPAPAAWGKTNWRDQRPVLGHVAGSRTAQHRALERAPSGSTRHFQRDQPFLEALPSRFGGGPQGGAVGYAAEVGRIRKVRLPAQVARPSRSLSPW